MPLVTWRATHAPVVAIMLSACGHAPVPITEVYRSQSPFADSGHATGLTVRTVANGTRIDCAGITLTLTRYGGLTADPESISYSYKVAHLQFDRTTLAIWSYTTLSFGTGCALPARLEVGPGPPRVTAFFPDAPGADRVRIAVDSSPGYTLFAGLRFERPTTVSIRPNGIVELETIDLLLVDSAGNRWKSRRVRLVGDSVSAIVLLRESP